MRFPIPDRLRDSVETFDGVPAETRDAATIVLLRDADRGTEAYLLRRQSTMDFAPGFYVFPGGKVQDSDRRVDAWVGPDADVWGDRLGCDPDTARGLVVAAVRETFEESGILLAGPDEHAVVSDTSEPKMQAARRALEDGETGFADFLAEHGLALRSDLLGAWSHWITPAFEPRRYDTRFFVAALPRGQVVGELPGEADRAAWTPLADVIEAVAADRARMLPPTLVTCREVAPFRAADVVAASGDRTVAPIEPVLVEVDGELFLENPLEDE